VEIDQSERFYTKKIYVDRKANRSQKGQIPFQILETEMPKPGCFGFKEAMVQAAKLK
jgi:hypothetical protein